ncbi:uncharacterized protein LOC144116164 isoform X3 [Amblyomma americanum]
MNGEPQQVVDKTHGAPQTLHRCPRRSPHSSTHQSPHCSPQRVPRLAFLGSDGETMGPISYTGALAAALTAAHTRAPTAALNACHA